MKLSKQAYLQIVDLIMNFLAIQMMIKLFMHISLLIPPDCIQWCHTITVFSAMVVILAASSRALLVTSSTIGVGAGTFVVGVLMRIESVRLRSLELK